ncbi:MAG: hypothetical protein R3C03_10815 [Pirellulaceae bacterium]
MTQYSDIAEDFYLNLNLNTEISLPKERETLLHYFEQVRKRYPTMKNFYARERGECILEEDKDSGFYRWTSIEPKRISSGWANPANLDEAMELHKSVLEMVPYALSVSTLDCETLNLTFGFDFAYRGNQQQLVMDALGYSSGFEAGLEREGSRLIGADFGLTLALTDDCRTQCRINIEPRTTAYQIRMGEYGEEPLSVYMTMRHYGSLDVEETYTDLLSRLFQTGMDQMESWVMEQVLSPIQQAILIK